MWVSYILLCRDIESACDEKVIKSMCMADKKGYSQALLTCSVQHSTSLANPIAFGEVGVKGRIRSVLRYEHPGLRVIAGAMALCLVVGACFLTDPVGAQDLGTERIGKITDYQSFEAEMSKRIDLHTYQVTDSSYSYAGESGAAVFRENGGFEMAGTLASGDAEKVCRDFCEMFSYIYISYGKL